MELGIILLVLAAALSGVALGWWFGQQSGAPARRERDRALADAEQLRGECEAWRGKFNEAVVNLASEAERTRRLTEVEAALAAERERTAAMGAQVAAFERGEIEREKAHQAQLAELKEAREALAAQFAEIGGKLLGDAQKQFLERADARFHEAGEKHEEKLKTLLQPVETTLKRYEEGLGKVEKERVDHYAGLREAVELVRAGQGQVRDEARRLVTALTSSPKQRGRWGERSLENVLTQAGLVKGIDFDMEVSTDGEDGRLRPDAVVRLPQGRKLIIDAKCSLNAYLDACDEVDDDKRAACFKAHLASIVRHSQQLGSKNYWAQFGDSAEFVVMYIPGEHFLSAALEQDSELWEKAFQNKVLLATPTNLVAIARTVASVWRQERLTEAAEEIARLGKELHSRLATMGEHMAKVGKNLQTANTAYNQMVGSFESQVFTQARRFESLGAGSAKELGSPPMIEASPRPLTKLAAPLNDDEAVDAAE